MATYNLNYSRLESLLDRSFSQGTENAIIEAIKNAGVFGPGSGKIGVDVESASGAFTVPSNDKIFLDTGASNSMILTTSGGTLIAAGDGSVNILDKGPGGDTIVGGAGAQTLKVTSGENLLIAGSGANTLVGGAGHDTLVGGGSSLLEAGSGGSTLIGGLQNQDDPGGDGGWGDGGHRHSQSGWGDDNRDGGDRHGHGGWADPGGNVPSDTLMGGSGTADLLEVSHGDNVLIAGSGRDTIDGGDGHDTIYGGGTDTINVNWGSEVIHGGSGTDRVNVGLHGNDTIYGGAATTVQMDQSSNSIKSEVEVSGVTTITFSNNQVLTASKVTIDFANGVHQTV